MMKQVFLLIFFLSAKMRGSDGIKVNYLIHIRSLAFEAAVKKSIGYCTGFLQSIKIVEFHKIIKSVAFEAS